MAMGNIVRVAAAAALGLCIVATTANSAGAVTGLFCQSIGQHLTNDHCCPHGQDWSTQAQQCMAAGHFGSSNNNYGYIDDFGNSQNLKNPCKKLHTC